MVLTPAVQAGQESSFHFDEYVSCTLKKWKNSTRHVFHCEAEALPLEPTFEQGPLFSWPQARLPKKGDT